MLRLGGQRNRIPPCEGLFGGNWLARLKVELEGGREIPDLDGAIFVTSDEKAPSPGADPAGKVALVNAVGHNLTFISGEDGADLPARGRVQDAQLLSLVGNALNEELGLVPVAKGPDIRAKVI